MRGREDDEEFLRQTVLSALIGAERPNDGAAYAMLYHSNAQFHQAMDMLVRSFLPAQVEGLAQVSEASHLRAERDFMLQDMRTRAGLSRIQSPRLEGPYGQGEIEPR